MSFNSINEKEALEAELNAKGYATRQLPGLVQPKLGYYRKPNGEIARLPVGPDRLAFYKTKGFEFIGMQKPEEPKAEPVPEQTAEAEQPKSRKSAKRKRKSK